MRYSHYTFSRLSLLNSLLSILFPTFIHLFIVSVIQFDVTVVIDDDDGDEVDILVLIYCHWWLISVLPLSHMIFYLKFNRECVGWIINKKRRETSFSFNYGRWFQLLFWGLIV